MSTYAEFLIGKTHSGSDGGFAPVFEADGHGGAAMSAPPLREHVRTPHDSRGGRCQFRGRHPLTPFAVWTADCPLGRRFDAADSDDEDAMDAGLAWALSEVGT